MTIIKQIFLIIFRHKFDSLKISLFILKLSLIIIPLVGNAQDLQLNQKKSKILQQKLAIRLNEFSQIHEKYTDLKPENTYKLYEGLTIAAIQLKVIDPVGLSVDQPTNDSLSKFAKFINKVTFNTPKKFAYKLLLFEEGDIINASIFAQTEKNIRENPHNKDILITITKIDSCNAVVNVIIQDKLSGYISPDFAGDRIGIGIYYNSLLGYPIEMQQSAALNFDAKNIIRYQGYLFWNQIKKARVRIGPDLYLDRRNQYYGARIEKAFISENTKWAGRFNNYFYRQNIHYDNSPNRENHYFRNTTWLAVSINPKIKLSNWKATRIIVSANAYINQYTKRPFVENKDIREYYFINRYYIGSIGLANWNYYKEKNIFNPNRYSFLPRGLNTNISLGVDYFEKQKNKIFFGAAINYSIYPKHVGHLFVESKIATFFNKYGNNEYNAQFKLNYISPLYPIKKWSFRYFVYNQMQLYFNKPKEIPFSTDQIIGYSGKRAFYSSQNYTLNVEPTFFCPYTFAGFNLSFFGFADIGVFGLSNRSDAILNNKQITQAYGAGFRLNNPDIGLGFIEVSFAYYPSNISDYNFNYQVPVSFYNRKRYDNYNLFDADYLNTR